MTVLEKGFAWNGNSYSSLSQIAKAMTGTAWNGHRFFGLRTATSTRAAQARRAMVSEATARPDVASDGPPASKTSRSSLLFTKRCGRIGCRERGPPGSKTLSQRGRRMKTANPKASLRRAVYTRVSTEHGLEQEFNSLDNQREASEAYIKSQIGRAHV